jgi:hypothetical protein
LQGIQHLVRAKENSTGFSSMTIQRLSDVYPDLKLDTTSELQLSTWPAEVGNEMLLSKDLSAFGIDFALAAKLVPVTNEASRYFYIYELLKMLAKFRLQDDQNFQENLDYLFVPFTANELAAAAEGYVEPSGESDSDSDSEDSAGGALQHSAPPALQRDLLSADLDFMASMEDTVKGQASQGESLLVPSCDVCLVLQEMNAWQRHVQPRAMGPTSAVYLFHCIPTHLSWQPLHVLTTLGTSHCDCRGCCESVAHSVVSPGFFWHWRAGRLEFGVYRGGNIRSMTKATHTPGKLQLVIEVKPSIDVPSQDEGSGKTPEVQLLAQLHEAVTLNGTHGHMDNVGDIEVWGALTDLYKWWFYKARRAAGSKAVVVTRSKCLEFVSNAHSFNCTVVPGMGFADVIAALLHAVFPEQPVSTVPTDITARWKQAAEGLATLGSAWLMADPYLELKLQAARASVLEMKIAEVEQRAAEAERQAATASVLEMKIAEVEQQAAEAKREADEAKREAAMLREALEKKA